MLRAIESFHNDSASRRAALGLAAGREVQADANSLDGAAVQTLMTRLAQLKRELAGVIAAGGTEFRRYTAQTLIAEVDRLIAAATQDVHSAARPLLTQANALGVAAAEEPIKAARIAVTPAPALDADLVTAAFDLTGDLLTVPMQQFRQQVVGRIRSAATTGASNGYVELAQNIGSAGFDAAAFKAERIVRTEMARVLNTATYGRLEGLARSMPFLRKGWRATRDGRTRQGHREAGQTYARGKGTIPIAEPFKVNVYQELPGKSPKLLGVALLRFPVDPNATPAGRIAAGATIMCRCNAFVDFDLQELRTFATSRSQGIKVDDTPAPKPVVPLVPKAPKAPRKPKAPLTAEQARAKVLAADAKYTSRKSTLDMIEVPRAEAAVRKARQRAEDLDASGQGVGAVYTAALERMDQELAVLAKLRREQESLHETRRLEMRKAVEVAAAARVKIPARWGKGAKTFGNGWSQAYKDNVPLPRVYTGGDAVRKRYMEAVRETERLVGHGSFVDVYGGTRAKVTIDRAADLANPRNAEGDRAYANSHKSMFGEANSINMGSSDHGRVVAHELGHLLEYNTPEIHAAAMRFLAERTKGETLERLSVITGDSSYKDHEVARKDKFISPYMGKDYGASASEIVSMGLEYMHSDPLRLAREDPDYFDFMYDLLRGKFRP